MNKLLISGLLLLVVIIVYLCFRKTKEMFSGSRVLENMANPYDSNNAINTDQELSSIRYENQSGEVSTISIKELKQYLYSLKSMQNLTNNLNKINKKLNKIKK